MSRPYSSSRGPKPLVAPKPMLVYVQEEDFSLHDCCNGYILQSDEESDTDAEREGIPRVEPIINNEHLVETLSVVDLPCSYENKITHESKQQNLGKEEELHIEGEYLVAAAEMDGPLSTTIINADFVPANVENIGHPDASNVVGVHSNTSDTTSIDQDSDSETSTQQDSTYLFVKELPGDSSDSSDDEPENLVNEIYEDSQCNRITLEVKDLPLIIESYKPSLVLEEYPYDVIGPPVDSEPSTNTLEDSWDNFQPYSVIESVPADMMNDTNCDLNNGDKLSTSDKQKAVDARYNEPCYYPPDNAFHTKDSQHHLKRSSTSELFKNGHSDVQTSSESLQVKDSDYADIDEAEDFRQLECPSSEDYVEIGDDDDDDGTGDTDQKELVKDSSSMEKNRNQNYQPRFRLCSITVPADMDLSGSEHTNRIVLADTSDALDDDIDFEGHIVPYFDNSDAEIDNISDEHVYEEAGLDSEGENFLLMERKSSVTRSRSLSGKVPGCVPETVPEESGTDYQTHDYYTVSLDNSDDLLGPQMESNRIIPSLKPRRFNLYPRSFSVEGRDMSLNLYRETDSPLGEEGRMKRMDDNLSLPCVIGSSGSFSQRSHGASSGMSTPTSVDIPPPFELAYITKKPITKSSPSLLIETDCPDKKKKKKTSFKRFLAMKFKRKTENKIHGDGNFPSRSSSESSHHGPLRVLDMERRSANNSPLLQSRSSKPHSSTDSITTFLFYNDGPVRKPTAKVFNNRPVSRVESFEDRSRPSFMPLPLTKPRSISFPSADTSDYENIPAISSDYENIQFPSRRPVRVGAFTEFFDNNNRGVSSANENDGYVDMSSFTGIEGKSQTPDQDPESAYTEPYTMGQGIADVEEDQGRTSEEEESYTDHGYDRHIDGRSRAYYIAKQLVDSERLHMRGLKLLHKDFREAVGRPGENGRPALQEEQLVEILGELPEVYDLHRQILVDMENRLELWEESQRMAEVILSRRAEFAIFTPFVAQYDRRVALLDESRQVSPAFSSIVRLFEHKSPAGGNVSLKYQLLQVIVRILHYRMMLTDYLNNLSPDSQEYEDTQAALVIVSDVADQANDGLRHGENLLRLVNIEYSVGGHRDLLQPGRVFVKEGTLMKVSRKSRQPRHLFLMNDLMLYTYPQQDGKYRLKNTLSLTGMKVSKPVMENVQHALKVEVADVSITLSASSCGEREDWFHTLSRTVAEHARGMGAMGGAGGEVREKLWASLGEKPPTLVPVSHVMMCMSCGSDFSLTLRRHHCHACGKIVCRSCSRNKYPLKYLKDRMAKVCDHCYAELRRRGGSVASGGANGNSQGSRASRPLSAVFQNIYPPSLWKPRKSTSNLSQPGVSMEGSTISGSLQRCKRSKRNWKKLWFLIKDKVLYTFATREDKVAAESLPLRGFTVKLNEKADGEDATKVFQLYHKKALYYTFRAEDSFTARRWIRAIEEATVL